MQEKKHGSERLLWAMYRQVDDHKLDVLAKLLRYDKEQLKQDIEAVQYVTVLNSDEIE